MRYKVLNCQQLVAVMALHFAVYNRHSFHEDRAEEVSRAFRAVQVTGCPGIKLH